MFTILLDFRFQNADGSKGSGVENLSLISHFLPPCKIEGALSFAYDRTPDIHLMGCLPAAADSRSVVKKKKGGKFISKA